MQVIRQKLSHIGYYEYMHSCRGVAENVRGGPKISESCSSQFSRTLMKYRRLPNDIMNLLCRELPKAENTEVAESFCDV